MAQQHLFPYAFMSKYKNGIQKIEVNYVPVNSVGVVLSYGFIYSIRPGKTVLVTFMLSNNEPVSLQTVSKVVAIFRKLQVLFHTDAARAVGKVPMEIRGDLAEADIMTLIGQK